MPLPTIAPMPTIANAGRLISAPGTSVPTRLANAAPRVAPMNSDGEKMPPDEPEPRLMQVAASLQTNSSSSSPPAASPPFSVAWIVE